MTRKLYSSLEAIEEAALFPEDNKELRLLLRQHAHVILDVSTDVLSEQEEDPESILAALLRSESNAFIYDALPDWQSNPEPLMATEAAGALFVLNRDETECLRISKKFGVCVVNPSSVQEAHYLMEPLARKELVQSEIYQYTVKGELRQGWRAALTIPELPISKVPLNALVVIDTHLFGDKGRFVANGKSNLIGILNSLLPPCLDIDFHLLIVAANGQIPFSKSTFAIFSQEIENALARPYELKIGLVTRPAGGKDRRSITGNYYFCTSQHGFNCFKTDRVDYNNDFVASGAFEGADRVGFNLPIHSMSTDLKTAKKLLINNQDYHATPGVHIDPNHHHLGFCKNRLLNLVSI